MGLLRRSLLRHSSRSVHPDRPLSNHYLGPDSARGFCGGARRTIRTMRCWESAAPSTHLRLPVAALVTTCARGGLDRYPEMPVETLALALRSCSAMGPQIRLVAFVLSVRLVACTGVEATREESDASTEDAAPLSACRVDGDCDDGVYCNGEGTCDAQHPEADPLTHCVTGQAPIVCDDGIACTSDHCDEAQRQCSFEVPDQDGDGHGDATCRDAEGTPLGDDCDEAHVTVYPGAGELCDGLDNDCNGGADELALCGLCEDGVGACDAGDRSGCDTSRSDEENCGRCGRRCHRKATCVASGGGFDCVCDHGYEGDGVTCKRPPMHDRPPRH